MRVFSEALLFLIRFSMPSSGGFVSGVGDSNVQLGSKISPEGG